MFVCTVVRIFLSSFVIFFVLIYVARFWEFLAGWLSKFTRQKHVSFPEKIIFKEKKTNDLNRLPMTYSKWVQQSRFLHITQLKCSGGHWRWSGHREGCSDHSKGCSVHLEVLFRPLGGILNFEQLGCAKISTHKNLYEKGKCCCLKAWFVCTAMCKFDATRKNSYNRPWGFWKSSTMSGSQFDRLLKIELFFAKAAS